jgi:hypothetical protein
MQQRVNTKITKTQWHIIVPVKLNVLLYFILLLPFLSAFNEDKDVHSATASTMFNVPLDAVTQEHRRKAKAINFGLIYGMCCCSILFLALICGKYKRLPITVSTKPFSFANSLVLFI